MHRIDSATATADKNGPGKTGFTGSSDPLVPATQLTAKWFNAVQEEIAYIIESAGLTLSDANTAQLFAALLVKFVALDANNHAAITASAGNNTALTAVGSGISPGILATGGGTNARGIEAQGTGGGAGVQGTGGALGAGVVGIGGASGAIGVIGGGTLSAAGVSGSGGSSSGNGVEGAGNQSGVGGRFTGGINGAFATQGAAIILAPSTQPLGPNVVGAMYVTAAGVLKICTAAGTPGTWISVGAQP